MTDEPDRRPSPLAPTHREQDWGALVFDAAPLGCAVTDTAGVLRAVNPAFAQFLGRRPGDLVGLHVTDITDPRDAPASLAGIRAHVEGRLEVSRQEKRYVHADGTSVWARTSAAPLRDDTGRMIGTLAQVEAIGDKLETERRLALSEAMLRTVFEASPIPKATLDPDGTVLAANAAMLTLTGARTVAELPWARLFGLAAAPDLAQLRRVLAGATPTWEFDCSVPRVGRGPVPVRTVTSCVESPEGGTQTIVQMVDMSAHNAALARAVEQARRDELTGLFNRRHFDNVLQAALLARRRDGQRLAVFMIDLDRFKQVNDGLGHAAGDEVLVEVARRIQGVCRHADTVGRIGGDEFWVVVADLHDEYDAIRFSTSVLRAMAAAFAVRGTAVHVGASIGFAFATADTTDAAELMRKADSAQYRAKELRCGWAAYSNDLDDQRLDRLDLAEDLRDAVAAEQIGLAYQPLFAAAGQIVGFEALARWQHPERGVITPDCFIPLAEQSHLIADLTRSVLRQALGQLSLWRASGFGVYVAVNVAPNLLHDDSLLTLVQEELAGAGVDAAFLTLEVTEGRLADGSSPMVESALARLRDLGVRLSIDDFGTGYSCLSYLKTLPVAELKIDRAFVADIETDTRDVAIVRTLVQLARTLRLHVVAEGVESEAAAVILRSLGCDTLQGYGLARPLSVEAATSLLGAAPRSALPTDPAGAPDRTEPAAVARVADQRQPGSRPMSVLTVDHDPEASGVLRTALAAAGHSVLEAPSGEQALLLAADMSPDLVILDHRSGEGLSGVETAVLLRSTNYSGPIILFSGSETDALTAYRFPLDVWPVAKTDHPTLLHLVAGCAESLATHS